MSFLKDFCDAKLKYIAKISPTPIFFSCTDKTFSKTFKLSHKNKKALNPFYHKIIFDRKWNVRHP